MSTARKIIKAAGLDYRGIQKTPKGDLHCFNASTGSTLMMGEVTPESLAEKLKVHNEQFGTGFTIAKFVKIIRGQREEADLPEETTHYDIFCHNCEGQETDQLSLADFARKVIELGWTVLSVERNQVECPECSNKEPNENDYAAQYRVNSGGRF